MTYGNHKSVDVYAISDRKQRALKIEVKTSQRDKFVTSISQKCLAEDPHVPDFWVLFQIRPGENGSFDERFFILTHAEIRKAQMARNQIYSQKCFARHGKKPDSSTGVDGVRIADVLRYQDQWSKIIDRLGGPATD